MSQQGEKGHFSTEIGQEVVEEALKAVEKRAEEASGAVAQQAPPPPAEARPKEEDIDVLKAELELSLAKGRELMARNKDEHEKLLRAVADFENFKKRALKEKDEVQRFGNEKLLKDFLPVFDNLDRALGAAKSVDDFESLRKGVEMIRKLFEDALSKHGIKAFSSVGQLFDPTRHEAMTAVETTQMPPSHVHSEILRGFTLNDRLVRPALVVVSRTPSAPATVAGDATLEPPVQGDVPKPQS